MKRPTLPSWQERVAHALLTDENLTGDARTAATEWCMAYLQPHQVSVQAALRAYRSAHTGETESEK